MTREVIIFENDNELAGMISDYRGCSQATVEMTTQPKFNKKSRTTKEPFEQVFKGNVVCTSVRYVSIGNDYAKTVQNRLLKEGKITSEQVTDFDTGSLPWGEWVEGSKILITHKEQLYLRLSYLNANGYKSEKIYHYENGKELNDDEIERLSEFLPVENDNNKYGLDQPVIVNTVKLSGFTAVRFDNKVFVRKGFECNEKSKIFREARKEYGDSMMSQSSLSKLENIRG